MTQSPGWALLKPDEAPEGSSMHAAVVPGPRIALVTIRGRSVVHIEADPAEIAQFAHELLQLAADAEKIQVQQTGQGS